MYRDNVELSVLDQAFYSWQLPQYVLSICPAACPVCPVAYHIGS